MSEKIRPRKNKIARNNLFWISPSKQNSKVLCNLLGNKDTDRQLRELCNHKIRKEYGSLTLEVY